MKITKIIIRKGATQQTRDDGSGKKYWEPHAYMIIFRGSLERFAFLSERNFDRMKKILHKLRRRVGWNYEIRYRHACAENGYYARHEIKVFRKEVNHV